MADTRNVVPPNLPLAPDKYERRWQDQFLSILRLYFSSVSNSLNAATKTPKDTLELTDGVVTPIIPGGRVALYIDQADGDLKIKFSDGTIKTIITD